MKLEIVLTGRLGKIISGGRFIVVALRFTRGDRISLAKLLEDVLPLLAQFEDHESRRPAKRGHVTYASFVIIIESKFMIDA